MSNLHSLGIDEMISYLNQAIELTPEAEKKTITKESAQRLFEVSVACFKLSKKHLEEYATVEKVWEEYLERCASCLLGLIKANNYSPLDKDISSVF